MEPPRWAALDIPGGAFNDAGYAAARSQALSQAAEMTVRPIGRMLEQVLAARLAEKSQLKQMQFMSEQQKRDFDARSMLQEQAREDQFAHEMLMAEQKRDAENRAAMAFYGASGGGGGAPMTTSAGGVQPGTGAMPYSGPATYGVQPGTGPLTSFENVYGAGPGGGVLDGVTTEQAAAMGVGGLDRIVNQREAARTNTRIVDEQARDNASRAAGEAAKAQAALEAAQAEAARADLFRKSLAADPDLDDKDVRRMTVRSYQGTDGVNAAAEEYEMIMAEKRKAASETAKEKATAAQKKETGFFEHKFPGLGAFDIPLEIRDKPKAGITDPAQMSPGAKSNLWSAARAAVGADKTLIGTIVQADAAGLIPNGQPGHGSSADAIRLRANEMAEQFGWQREASLSSTVGGESAGAAPAEGAATAKLDHKGVYGELIKQYGRDPTRREFEDAMRRNSQGIPLSAQEKPAKAASADGPASAPASKSPEDLRKAAGSYISRSEQREIDDAKAGAAKTAGERTAAAAQLAGDRAFLQSAVGSIPKTAAERKDALDRLDDLIDDSSGGYKDKLKRARSLLYDLTSSGGS